MEEYRELQYELKVIEPTERYIDVEAIIRRNEDLYIKSLKIFYK